MPETTATRRVRGVAVAVLAVALAMTLLTAFGIRKVSAEQQRTDAAAEASAAARQIAVDFAAYDYRHLSEDFKRVLDESTGEFHQLFLKESTGAEDLIVAGKTVSTAQVAGAAVVSATDDRATVLVAVNRTLHQAGGPPEGTFRPFAAEVTLVQQGGRWLATGLKPL